MTSYDEICQRYKVRSLCDLANKLDRLGFPQPEKFKVGQTWYNTGGSRVEIVMRKKKLAADYYLEGRFFRWQFIENKPGAFATYLPTIKEIEQWEISKAGKPQV